MQCSALKGDFGQKVHFFAIDADANGRRTRSRSVDICTQFDKNITRKERRQVRDFGRAHPSEWPVYNSWVAKALADFGYKAPHGVGADGPTFALNVKELGACRTSDAEPLSDELLDNRRQRISLSPTFRTSLRKQPADERKEKRKLAAKLAVCSNRPSLKR